MADKKSLRKRIRFLKRENKALKRKLAANEAIARELYEQSVARDTKTILDHWPSDQTIKKMRAAYDG